MRSFIIFISFLLLLVPTGCETNQQVTISIAQNFNLPDIEGVERTLADYEADLIMLHFWADWCPHCRAEFEDLEQAYRNLKDKGFLIVAVNVGQTAELVRGIKETYKVTFPMLCDADKDISKAYQVKGLPVSFFLDSEHRILHHHNGWLKADQIRKKFKELI
jgi:peroxiredoxin